jgi:YidC/Oxa1 family membrane protein insertase
MIMLALPIVFVAFIINFPAGLMVYWITTNCWTIVQQLIVRKTVGLPNRRPELAGAGAPVGAAALAGGGKGDDAPVRAKAGRVMSRKRDEDAAPSAEETARRAVGGPPPSARRKKKRSGRRR